MYRKSKTMTYTNCINMHHIEYLDLFDDLPYKYVKSIINCCKTDEDKWEYDFEVDIKDLDCDRVAWCKTKFTFTLEIDVSGGSLPLMVDKKFVVIKEYNSSSPMALYICENLDEEEEEEEEEEDDEE